MEMRVPAVALERLRPIYTDVEGTCEAWSDEEILRRVFIRGAMEYAKAAGRPWEAVQQLAAELRADLEPAG